MLPQIGCDVHRESRFTLRAASEDAVEAVAHSINAVFAGPAGDAMEYLAGQPKLTVVDVVVHLVASDGQVVAVVVRVEA